MKLKEIFKIEKKFSLLYLGFVLSLIVYFFIYIAGSLGPMRLNILSRGIVPDEYLTEFVVLIPGSLITDLIVLYTIPIVFLFIFLKFAPSLLSGSIKIHKFSYIMRTTPQYGIIKSGQKRSKLVLIRRSWTVGFFSFTIAAYLVNIGLAPLFRAKMMDMDLNIAEAMFLGTFFFTFLALFTALPVWLLEDAGFVFYRSFPEDLRSPSLKGTYVLYKQVLDFFTGVSSIILLYNIITRCFDEIQPGDPAILTPLILLVLPLFVSGLIAIPLIIYEKLLPETIENVQNVISKKNCPFIKEPVFDELILPNKDIMK